MTISDPTTTATASTSAELAAFVHAKAEQARDELGFGWRGTPTAPSTYQQLRGAFAHSLSRGEPLPISDEFCDTTIFPDPADNVVFRFWHDVSHVRLGLSFNLEDELELALWHLDELEAAGYKKGSSVYRLFEADLIGQVLIMALIRRFPTDQTAFVRGCIEHGLLQGLLHEARRLP